MTHSDYVGGNRFVVPVSAASAVFPQLGQEEVGKVLSQKFRGNLVRFLFAFSTFSTGPTRKKLISGNFSALLFNGRLGIKCLMSVQWRIFIVC